MIFSSAQTGLSFDSILPSGKYRDRKVLDICVEDMDYLRWMMDNGTIFADKVLRCIRGTHPKAFDFHKYNKTKKNL
jgi:hypothetical protein